MDIDGNQSIEQYCDGVRVFSGRTFDSGMPWIMPLDCDDLAQNGKLDVQNIPTQLEVFGNVYPLGDLTFWNGGHFLGRIRVPDGKGNGGTMMAEG